MTQWIGGLPPAAHERIERQRASGTSGSLFSAPAAAAAKSAGLDPVGEVFGCLVMNLGWVGSSCGYWGGGLGGGGGGFGGPFGQGSQGGPFGGGNPGLLGGIGGLGNQYAYTTPVLTSGGTDGGRAGFGPYVKAYEAAWHGALERMQAEARALGADGIVGVTVTRSRIEGQSWEFAAVGTAVRSTDTSLVGRPKAGEVWTAGLSAEDCAAAIHSGFVPREIALGLSVSTKHEDYQLKQQRSSWSNTEVDGLTRLLTAARHDARNQLVARARHFDGADLAITRTSLTEFETPCGQEVDVHAEAVFVGTILTPGPMASFRTAGRPGTAKVMTVLPLTDPASRPRR